MSNGLQVWHCVNYYGSKYEKCTALVYTQPRGLIDIAKVHGRRNKPLNVNLKIVISYL